MGRGGAHLSERTLESVPTVPGVSKKASAWVHAAIAASSLLVIGSIPGIPLATLWWCTRLWNSSFDGPGSTFEWITTAVLAPLAGYFLIPPRRRPLHGRLWDAWLDYFAVRVVYRGGNPLPKGQYLYAMAPHGLYPFAGACASISSMVNVFPGIRFAVARVGFWIPVIRYFLFRLGCITPDRPSIVAALQEGDSVAIFPGGIAEMVRTNDKCEELVLKRRLGFVRTALELKVPIVPVYVFGQSMLFSQVPLPAWMERVSRALRLSIIFPYGRFGLLIPRYLPLLYAVGEPITCSVGEAGPTEEDVRQTHAKVILAVQDLYDTYKHMYGWHSRPLSIK